MENFEDAGVYRISDDVALVQSVDIITPVVDDPFRYGQISAANALSDIYAMGARPITALNIAGFPSCDFDDDLLVEIQKGGIDKLDEADCALLGGHTLDDVELKYGLSVTGTVHPKKVIYNCCAKAGDVLILTKPIGNGIITTANKAELANKEHVEKSILSMIELNKVACEVMVKHEVNACTDVSGFGLLGHLYEVVHSSNYSAQVSFKDIKLFDGVYEYASMGLIPAGSYSNEEFLRNHFNLSNTISKTEMSILCDPQTSGGLLICINEKSAKKLLKDLLDSGIIHAHIIGMITEKKEKPIIII